MACKSEIMFGSVEQSICCSHSRPRFGYHYVHDNSQLHVNQVPREVTLFSDFPWMRQFSHCTYMHAKNHKYKVKSPLNGIEYICIESWLIYIILYMI